MYGYIALLLLGFCASALAAVSCPDVYCFNPCPNGYVADANGCMGCSCRQADNAAQRECSDAQCFVPCDHGYMLDQATGCLTCTCAAASVVDPNPSVQQGLIGPSQGADAKCRIRCVVPCDNGYVMDSMGCPTCSCMAKDMGGDVIKPLVNGGAGGAGGAGGSGGSEAKEGQEEGQQAASSDDDGSNAAAGLTGGVMLWVCLLTAALRRWMA